ncbi:MAG: hypothetical protein ABI743_14070 [bacterium]
MGTTPESQRPYLRPTLLTLSAEYYRYKDNPPLQTFAPPPATYSEATNSAFSSDPVVGAADAYMFDFYPWKRTKAGIQVDYTAVSSTCAPDYSDHPYDKMDPVQTITWLRQLRMDVNHGSATVHSGSQPGYRPVIVWCQADGIRLENADTRFPPDPISGRHGQNAPAVQKKAIVTGDCGKPGLNYRRLPILAEFQFFLWAAFFELSEGAPTWAQSGAPDRALRDEFSKAMGELKYFEHSRVRQFIDDRIAKGEIQTINFLNPTTPPGLTLDPVVRYFTYNKPGFAPSTWLILLNHNPLVQNVTLTFNSVTSDFSFRRYDFLAPQAEVQLVKPSKPSFTTGVGGRRVKIFKRQ